MKIFAFSLAVLIPSLAFAGPADLAIETFRHGRSQIGGCLQGAGSVRYCEDGVYTGAGKGRRRLGEKRAPFTRQNR